MKILIIGGLSDNKLKSKILPLINNPKISSIFLYRYTGNPFDDNSKVKLLVNPTVRLFNINFKLNRKLFEFISLIKIFFYIPIYNIKLVVGIYIYPHGLIASILSRIYKIKSILILPGTDLKLLSESKKGLSLLKNIDFFGMRGNNSISKMQDLGFENNKLFVLPNYMDSLKKVKIKENRNYKYDLVFTGYLRKLKRLDILLEIVSELKKDFPNINCAIVGDGIERDELQHLAVKLNIEKNIIFIPHTNAIEKILLESKVFVITSQSEGLPMSIIEAMMCGLPIVSSNINDIPDIIEHGVNGYLVEFGDVNLFATKLKLLLSDLTLVKKMGDASSSKIDFLFKTQYSYEKVEEIWDELLLKRNE